MDFISYAKENDRKISEIGIDSCFSSFTDEKETPRCSVATWVKLSQ